LIDGIAKRSETAIVGCASNRVGRQQPTIFQYF
jgi:hypothetical protein